MSKPINNELRLEIEKRACLGKDKHKSELAADYVANNFKGRNNPTVEVYKCAFCGFWHIGHNKKHELAKFNKK